MNCEKKDSFISECLFKKFSRLVCISWRGFMEKVNRVYFIKINGRLCSYFCNSQFISCVRRFVYPKMRFYV